MGGGVIADKGLVGDDRLDLSQLVVAAEAPRLAMQAHKSELTASNRKATEHKKLPQQRKGAKGPRRPRGDPSGTTKVAAILKK